DRRVSQPQRVGCQDRRHRPGGTVPRQDVENDVGGMDAVGEASAQAASTAAKPSLSTADSTLTIWRSPSSEPCSLRRTRSRLAGKSQSLNGAPLRKAPGFLVSTGT